MRFDEAVSPLAIALLIVKLAHLTSEHPLLAENLGFPLLNEPTVALPDAMQSGESTSFGCFRAFVVDRESRVLGYFYLAGIDRTDTQPPTLGIGLADELHLVVAPFFVGDSRAQRFVGDGSFPWNPDRRAELAEVRRIGDVVLLRYALSDRFDQD